MTTPESHVSEAHKLTADGLVDLFEITLQTVPVVLRYKNENSVTWQGNLYEGIAIRLAGDRRSADEEEARPTLTMMNPIGIFNPYVRAGYFDLATVVRKRVLRQHLEADVNLYEQRMWFVSRPRELIANQGLTLEMRNMSEGPNFFLPVRQFIPPEFPSVTLA